MEVTVTTNAGTVAAKLAAKAEAMRNLRLPLAVFAGEVDRVTAEAFRGSRRVDGLPFPDLTDSTIIGRLQRRKGKWRKAMAGKKARGKKLRKALHAGDYAGWASMRQAQRDKVLSAAKALNFKPLIDTGRMRNSARTVVLGKTKVRWSIVDYAIPHVVGAKNGKPPQRNPSVFRKLNGEWTMFQPLTDFLIAQLRKHIAEAEAKA